MAKKLGIPFQEMDITRAVRTLGVQQIMPHANAAIARFGIVVSLSLAVAYAHQKGMEAVLIALHNDDAESNIQYSKRYIEQLNVLATMSGVPHVFAPLLCLSKAEVFELGLQREVDFSDTWSCSESGDEHCGNCGACEKRHSAFISAGIADPTRYSKPPCAIALPKVNQSLLTR